MKGLFSALLLTLCAALPANQISTWSSPPDIISTSGVDATNPIVGMDSNANVVAIWLEGGAVVSRSLPLGGSWDTLATVSATGASNPGLAVDGAGNATAIWLESGVVKTATKPFGSSWGSSSALSGSSASSPHLAMDSSGNLAAIWVESGAVKAATHPSGGSWSAATTLASSGDSPDIYIGDSHFVVAVWHSVNGVTSIDNVNSATLQLGGSWSSSTIVSDPAVYSVQPTVAVDPNGNAVAVWFTYTPSGIAFVNTTVVTSTLPVGGSWSTPQNLSSPGAANPSQLYCKIVLKNDDKVMAIWTQTFDGDNYYIQSAVTNDKIVWSTATTMNESLYSLAFDVAPNSTNEVFSVYMFYDPSIPSTEMVSAESTLEGFSDPFWTNPVIISGAANNAYPRIAVGVTGTSNCYGQALWNSYDGTHINVSTSSGTGSLVAAPTNVAVVQNVNNFGAFQEYYNTLTWTDSVDPDVLGYTIYRNGTQCGFVASGVGQFIDNNRIQGGSVVYGIASSDNTGTQSAVVTVNYP